MGSRAAQTPPTKRELEVIPLLARGLSFDAVAAELSISRSTVADYVQFLKRYYGARNVAHLVAIQLGAKIRELESRYLGIGDHNAEKGDSTEGDRARNGETRST